MCFPSYKVAKRCREFIKAHTVNQTSFKIRVLQLSTLEPSNDTEKSTMIGATIGVVFSLDQNILWQRIIGNIQVKVFHQEWGIHFKRII